MGDGAEVCGGTCDRQKRKGSHHCSSSPRRSATSLGTRRHCSQLSHDTHESGHSGESSACSAELGIFAVVAAFCSLVVQVVIHVARSATVRRRLRRRRQEYDTGHVTPPPTECGSNPTEPPPDGPEKAVGGCEHSWWSGRCCVKCDLPHP